MIETLTLEAATERLRAEGLRISKDTLRDGIQQKVFPFGDYVERTNSKAPWCYIYADELEDWIMLHSSRVKEKK